MCDQEPVLRTEQLAMKYRHRGKRGDYALQPLDLTIVAGEIVGVIGESGSGKSTLLKLIAGAIVPFSGSIWLSGQELTGRDPAAMACRKAQMIFQNPEGSFNPRRKMRRSIEEHMKILRPGLTNKKRDEIIDSLLERVGIAPALASRYPGEVSGGQCQRIAIARALAVKPELLLCDEITSALDMTVQAEIMQLLKELQQEEGMAILFVSHDLALAGNFCQRLLVMKDGCHVESGSTRKVLYETEHEYTKQLLERVKSPVSYLQEREAL